MTVFNKVVLTALKYTPVVLAHHMPFKTLANGKIKVQQPKKPNQSLNRLILSHFSTLLHLIKSLPSHPSSADEAGGLLANAVTESAKLLPWVLGARKHLRAYLKVLLELWSSASDSVRIAAFLVVRKTFVAGDDALKDLCLRVSRQSSHISKKHRTYERTPTANSSHASRTPRSTLSPRST